MNKKIPDYAFKSYRAFLADERTLRVEEEREFILLYAKIPVVNRRIKRAAEDWELIEALIKKSKKT